MKNLMKVIKQVPFFVSADHQRSGLSFALKGDG